MGLKPLKISTELPLYMLLIGMVGIQIAIPVHINSLVSFGTWLIVFATFLSFAFAIMTKKIKTRYMLNLIILVACVVFSMVCSFDFKYQGIVVAISYLEIPLLLVSYPICKKNIKKAIYASFLILSMYYHWLSFMPFAHLYYTDYGQIRTDFMTLGYNNPNETAMYLLICILILGTMLSEVKRRIWKILLAVDLFLLMRLVMLTLSRTALVVLVFFIICFFVYRKKNLPSFLQIVCFAVPIIFVLFTFYQKKMGGEMIFLGEAVETGRWDIYVTVFEEMSLMNFFFGKYSFYFKNLHNAIWSIFATTGIVGATVFYVLLYRKVREIYIKNRWRNQTEVRGALLGLLSVIGYTATEAAYITAGGSFAVSVISLYLLCIAREKK